MQNPNQLFKPLFFFCELALFRTAYGLYMVKRHRNSMFTAAVTVDADWKPPKIAKSDEQKDKIVGLIAKGA